MSKTMPLLPCIHRQQRKCMPLPLRLDLPIPRNALLPCEHKNSKGPCRKALRPEGT